MVYSGGKRTRFSFALGPAAFATPANAEAALAGYSLAGTPVLRRKRILLPPYFVIVTPESIHTIFETMCRKLHREPCFKNLYFVEGFELQNQLGISMTFVFEGDTPMKDGKTAHRRMALTWRIPRKAIELPPPPPHRMLCRSCAEFFSKPISADEVVEMVFSARRAQSFSELVGGRGVEF